MGVTQGVEDTLRQFHLTRKNHCVVLEGTETVKGMLQKAKDYVTWGEASDEVVAKLKAKGDAPYRLSPPRGGFKGSIKLQFNQKGALGYRGDKINALILRML